MLLSVTSMMFIRHWKNQKMSATKNALSCWDLNFWPGFSKGAEYFSLIDGKILPEISNIVQYQDQSTV
jgi:hypothetical protein